MENIVLIIIGLAIIYQGYMIFKSQRKLKYDMKKMKDDYNIEFGATEGSGIEVVKKQFCKYNINQTCKKQEKL